MINTVHLKGKISRNPKFGKGPKGTYMFASLATSTDGRDTYHNIAAFQRVADDLRDLAKGDTIELKGTLRYRKYDLENGKSYREASVVIEKFKVEKGTASEMEEDEADVPF